MLPDHFKPRPPRTGGCFTCHFAGEPIDSTGHDRRLRCSRPGYWPTDLPEKGFLKGSYKNSHSHRCVALTPPEAREMILIASHLLKIVRSGAKNKQE